MVTIQVMAMDWAQNASRGRRLQGAAGDF